ncbi:Concanavalin A-like lectins/glucanase [Penicillium macrosclerotiorum]|uniref:Concanavalin A-like lectins/glucanase n=1 Tax=Penicillium macrosclerotiorum TaxID=303699 RepID=UPI002549A975|nr:Concanavalin A-like lectins/glucanase [Penicillium macrosclerotiorum]KAJ5668787.1 Concanavalin A-like lectins/glucanase [Penicillium macrosclerotiorum]
MASASNPGFYLLASPGSIEASTQDGTSYARGIVSGVSICDGMWHHIAAVRAGAEFVIYLDAVALPTQQSTNGSPPLNINSSDRMMVGAVDSSSIDNQHYDGLLSEVRFWSEARTPHQIPMDVRFRLQADSIKSSLIGYWPAIFGITLDFSPTRNTYRSWPTDYGIYALEAETSTNNWSPTGQLAVTSTGFVVLKSSTILDGAKYFAARLKWSSSGSSNTNPSTGILKFRMRSSDPTYWPAKQVGELCEGIIQPNGSASTNIRGTLMPQRIGCGVVLNVGTGLVLTNRNGTAVVSPGISTAPGHLCRYAGDKLYDMMTQLAIQVHAASAGHSVQFAAPDPSQDSLQSFDFNTSGNFALKSSQTVALGVDGANSVVTVPLDMTDDSQKWLALSDARIFWNDLASSAVLNGNGTSLSVVGKSEGNPTQSWYKFRNSFFCEGNNLALTINGISAPGVSLCLARWSRTNTSQEFVLRGGLLIHKHSNLIVVAQGNIGEGATVVLAEKTSNNQPLGAQWSLSAFAPPIHGTDDDFEQPDFVTDGANHLVTYNISITTSSRWFSGTNDTIEVALADTAQGEAFNIASLEYRDRPMRRVRFVYIACGRANWLSSTHWRCDRIVVRQSNITDGWAYSSIRDLWSGSIGHLMRQYETLYMDQFYSTTDSTMRLGKAPGRDESSQAKGWYHTWISVVSDVDPSIVTYFDCAGGHGGEGAQDNVLERKCVLNDIVLMSTGKSISSKNLLQPTYGTDRTDGVGNANLPSDGKINWDGQCHQIA